MPADEPVEALIADSDRPVCDCPEPCGCYAEGYAAGKGKAYFEVLASLEGPPHAGDCGCQPCQVKRACIRKVMTLMARSSPALFELLEAWAVEDHSRPELPDLLSSRDTTPEITRTAPA